MNLKDTLGVLNDYRNHPVGQLGLKAVDATWKALSVVCYNHINESCSIHLWSKCTRRSCPVMKGVK